MSALYNRGKKILADGSLDYTSSTIRAMLVNTNYVFNPDHAVVADIVTHEISGTGYVRKDLAGKTAVQNDTNDRAELDSDDIEWTGINAGTVKGLAYFKVNTSDADHELIGFVDSGGFPVDTNGTNLTVQQPSSGWLHQQ